LQLQYICGVIVSASGACLAAAGVKPSCRHQLPTAAAADKQVARCGDDHGNKLDDVMSLSESLENDVTRGSRTDRANDRQMPTPTARLI